MIAFSALSSNTGAGFSNTYAHTPSGTPRGVVVVVLTGEAITSVTYGGQAMQAGTPVQGTSGPFAPLSAHIYTLTSGVPTGTQNVVVSGPANNTSASYCFSVTADADTEIIDVIGLVGNVANPSGLLELGGREAFCALVLLSDHDDPSDVTPLSGWTSRVEFDAGVVVTGAYTYDTIGTADVTAGWTQTAEDVLGIAFAIGEVVAVEPDTVAAGFTAVPVTSFPSSITEGDAPSTVAAGFTEVPVTSFPALVIDVAALRWITLGDSQTDEYKADDNRIDSGPWRPFVLNWLEQLARPDLGQPYPSTHHRSLDIGAWGTRAEPRRTGFERNLARSGSQMDDVVADQLALAESIIEGGDADIGVLFGTGNEWGNPFQTPYLLDWIYNGSGTLDSQGVPVTTRMETVYGYYDTVMSALAPILPVGLVVVMPPDYGSFPLIFSMFPDATRRGYVTSAVEYLHGLIEARAEAINVAEGRTAVVTIPYDHYIKPDIWETADGTHVTVAGVELDYSSNSTDGNPYHFNIAPQSAIPHAGTIVNGVIANTVIAAANQLVGVSIQPFSDAEIRENAGIEAEAEVAPADVSHGHTVESPTLTQGYVITPDNVSHGHTAASPALSQAHQIAPANVAHAHTAASPGLSQALNLAAADVSHEHTAASPSLTQAHLVDPANVSHTHTAAAPGLTQAHVIEPADASHTHMAGSPQLAPAGTLTVQDVTHAHTAGSPALTQASQLEPDDVAHGHSAGSPTITQAFVVAPLSVDHAHTAGSPGLVVEGMIVPADVFHAHPVASPGLTQAHVLVPDDVEHPHTAGTTIVVDSAYRAMLKATPPARSFTLSPGGRSFTLTPVRRS